MRHAYAVKKLSKFGQVFQRGTASNFYCVIGARVIEWFTTNHFGYQEVNCLKIRGINDHDDILSDYRAGSYVDSLDQAIRRDLNSKHKRWSLCLLGDRYDNEPTLWVTCLIGYEGKKFVKTAKFELSATIPYEIADNPPKLGSLGATSNLTTNVHSSAEEVIAIAEGVQEQGLSFPTNVLHGFLEETFPKEFDYINDLLNSCPKKVHNVSE